MGIFPNFRGENSKHIWVATTQLGGDVNIATMLGSDSESEINTTWQVVLSWKKGSLLETNSSHLKMDGWNTSFLLGWPIFRCYVSFRECRFLSLLFKLLSDFKFWGDESVCIGLNDLHNKIVEVHFCTPITSKHKLSKITSQHHPTIFNKKNFSIYMHTVLPLTSIYTPLFFSVISYISTPTPSGNYHRFPPAPGPCRWSRCCPKPVPLIEKLVPKPGLIGILGHKMDPPSTTIPRRLMYIYIYTYPWSTSWWLNHPSEKYMQVKLDHFPKVRDENKKSLKPPPSKQCGKVFLAPRFFWCTFLRLSLGVYYDKKHPFPWVTGGARVITRYVLFLVGFPNELLDKWFRKLGITITLYLGDDEKCMFFCVKNWPTTMRKYWNLVVWSSRLVGKQIVLGALLNHF